MSVVLYQFWRSSASWRVRWALAIKGIEAEIVPVDIGRGEHEAEPHRARSPLGRVPALRIDGRVLSESVAIIEYLEQTRPTPALYPVDPWRRARARQVVELVNSGIQPLQIGGVKDRVSPDPAVQEAWVQHFASRGLAALERLLADIAAETLEETGVEGPFCLGRRLSVADLFLVPQVAHSRRSGVQLSDFPRILAAEAAALATPGADAVRPERQPGAPSAA